MKLHNLCSKDPKRLALNYIRIKDGFAYVTDATVYAKIPIELLPGGFLKKEDDWCIASSEWKASKIWEAVQIERIGKSINCVSKKGVTYTFFLEDPSDINYPDIERYTKKDFVPIENIALDASILANIQESLNMEYCILCFSGKRKVITIHSPEHKDFVAGIMPINCQ